MDALPLGSSYTDDDEKNLKQLLETFGSVVSLDEIASAYCESGRNFCSTVEILNRVQGCTGSSSSKSQSNVENVTSASSTCTLNNESENAHIVKLKTKKSSATLGTVIDVIGKDYITPRSHSNESNEKAKPAKLYSKDIPAPEIWDEKKELAPTSSGESKDGDMQEFLFNILGNGLHLDMSVIQDVVGQCGDNIPMSIDKLLDLSLATLEKSDDVIDVAAGISKPAAGRLMTTVNTRDESILPETETNKTDVKREILEALFTVPSITEEKKESAVRVRPAHKSRYGNIVTKPLEDTIIEDFTFITRKPIIDRPDEANESSYEDLRKAVNEYWAAMKEYYKAGLDALIKKDYKTAERLMEEGNFYAMKAREADEKSTQKLTEDGDEEEFSLNMHYLEPKDAMKNLRLQLTLFSGLPSISYLKVVVGTGDGDKQDMKRKRLITRVLEKEGIPWTEEGNGWTISIKVKEIDPRKLSFANK